jgi:nitrogen fixation protein NifU and related proteins
MDALYRDYILDHYKNPRNYGDLDDPKVSVEGQNPLCGDHLHLDVRVEDGRVSAIRFSGKGCAISQAATSMLTEMVEGKSVDEVVALGREDIVEEVGIPLSPMRLKCALLGLGTLKVALNRAVGTPLPEEWAGMDEVEWA